MTEHQNKPSGLENFFVNIIAAGVLIGLAGAVLYIIRPLPALHDSLPSENASAITNNVSTNYCNLGSNDVDRVLYEQLEIKPYQ